MTADIQELHEQAEQGASDGRIAPVSISMAVLAVLAAVASLMGGRLHAEAMLDQTQATDQWSQYQAKVIRERSYEVFLDQVSVFTLQDPARADELKAKYAKEIERYTAETKDIEKQASAEGDEVEVLERRSDWFDFASILFEASLVSCSITLLTRKRLYWYMGLASGFSGLLLAVAGWFVR